MERTKEEEMERDNSRSNITPMLWRPKLLVLISPCTFRFFFSQKKEPAFSTEVTKSVSEQSTQQQQSVDLERKEGT